MQTDEFIARVQQAGTGLNPDAAKAATFATIQALCEHLPAEETRRLASQLPADLTEIAEAGGGRSDLSERPIALADFHAKLADRAGIPAEEAAAYAGVVVQVLQQAITAGEFGDVALELPSELDQLLAAG